MESRFVNYLAYFFLINYRASFGEKIVELYRDDRLAAINSSSGPALDKMGKKIIALFKNEGLSTTIETNLFKTDFLDVSFNLL